MKYMAMLKNQENTHPEALQKVQKDLFTVFTVGQGKHFSKKDADLKMLERLKAIVRRLDAPDITYDEALRLVDEGSAIWTALPREMLPDLDKL